MTGRFLHSFAFLAALLIAIMCSPDAHAKRFFARDKRGAAAAYQQQKLHGQRAGFAARQFGKGGVKAGSSAYKGPAGTSYNQNSFGAFRPGKGAVTGRQSCLTTASGYMNKTYGHATKSGTYTKGRHFTRADGSTGGYDLQGDYTRQEGFTGTLNTTV